MSVSESPSAATSPLYDVRPAGWSLGALAGTIAGFAITAVVLLSQVTPKSSCEHSLRLRTQFPKHCVLLAERFSDRAAVGFIFAVFGCTVAAIELIGVAGERDANPRGMAISICARIGFVISLAVVFWGLAVIAALAFGKGSVTVARFTYFGWNLAVPPLLGFVYVESEQALEKQGGTQPAVPLGRFFGISGLGFLVLLAGGIARTVHGSRLTVSTDGYINAVFLSGVALVVLSMVAVLAYGRHPPTHGMGRVAAGAVITACCLFVAALTQLLPP